MKNCPQCSSNDVPKTLRKCPFCGYDFKINIEEMSVMEGNSDSEKQNMAANSISKKDEDKKASDLVADTEKEAYKKKFDIRRFLEESKEADYIKAMEAYTKEDFVNARLYFANSYRRGNILAGIKLGQMDYWGEAGKKDYESALKLFVEGANYGYPLATDWLVEAYRVGKGVPKDIDKAKELAKTCRTELEEMCVCGDVDAQYMHGWNLLYGKFCENEEEKGFYWMHRASEEKHLKAKVELARCYLDGRGCVQDTEKGLRMMKQLAATSSKKAHYHLGEMYLYGQYVEKDYKKALSLLKFAAEKEHVTAMRYMGDIYYYGYDVEKDYKEAEKWYKLAASQGNKRAYCQLGMIYSGGYGVKRDVEKEFQNFKIAADMGEEIAQYMLHVFYFDEGKYRNYTKGVEYLEKAAEQGFTAAQVLLARVYLDVVGNVRGFENEKKFVYWIRKAAEQGDAEAQRILGLAYYKWTNEDALTKSYPDAAMWLEKASDGGDIEATIELIRFYEKGLGVEKDIDKASDLFKIASNRIAQLEDKIERAKLYNLAADICYEVFPQKRQVAFNYYATAFLDGNLENLYDLGWMYLINNYKSSLFKLTKKEFVNVIIENEDKSNKSELAYLLGHFYDDALEMEEAEKWYLKAIEKGSITSICRLAYIYVNKWQKYKEGFDLLEQAYQLGSVEGTRLLAECYKSGIGTKKNRSMAKKLYKEAAEKGDEEAAEKLKKFWF